VFGSNDNLLASGNNSNIGNTITDLQVGLTQGNEYKPNIQYTPSGEYRILSLIGNNPFSAVQISVYWKDYYGGLHPFTLGNGNGGNLKIMFRKKTYGKTFPVG
jgi:hypothetical protein